MVALLPSGMALVWARRRERERRGEKVRTTDESDEEGDDDEEEEEEGGGGRDMEAGLGEEREEDGEEEEEERRRRERRVRREEKRSSRAGSAVSSGAGSRRGKRPSQVLDDEEDEEASQVGARDEVREEAEEEAAAPTLDTSAADPMPTLPPPPEGASVVKTYIEFAGGRVHKVRVALDGVQSRDDLVEAIAQVDITSDSHIARIRLPAFIMMYYLRVVALRCISLLRHCMCVMMCVLSIAQACAATGAEEIDPKAIDLSSAALQLLDGKGEPEPRQSHARATPRHATATPAASMRSSH